MMPEENKNEKTFSGASPLENASPYIIETDSSNTVEKKEHNERTDNVVSNLDIKKNPQEEALELTSSGLRQYLNKTLEEQSIQQKRFQSMREKISDFDKIQKKFYQISPNTLFFDTKLLPEIFEVIEDRFKNLKKVIPGAKTSDFWNEEEINYMFGKGFNPTSLVTSAESAEWFSKELKLNENKPVIVAELGSGAGWSTTMLFRNLEKVANGRKRYINSIDMSPHAIATTQALLEYYGVPYILVENKRQRDQLLRLINTGEVDSCVILNLGRYDDILKEYPNDYFNGIYSTHGSAYLSEKEYEEIFKIFSKKGKDNSIFIADSLNPQYTNRLSSSFLLFQMLFPNISKKILDKLNIKYVFAKKGFQNTSKYFPLNSEVKVIKIFNEKRADLIIKWANYLIRTLRISRLLETKKSLSVTMDVVERYRSDVFPSSQLKRITKKMNSNTNKHLFEELPNKPDFTIFLETIGFKLNKK